MRNILFLFLLVISFVTIASCTSGKKKSRQQQIEEFRSTLTSEDTVTMLKLCDDAMEKLKRKEIDNVLLSLFEYTDSTKEVKPLTDATAKRYKRMFTMFPVLEYKRNYFTFSLEGCNDVKYEIVFATAEQVGNSKPAKTHFMFNPVKIDGEWKLCVKTAADEIDRTIK